MITPLLTVCGVMSGSSMDGLDLAICQFECSHKNNDISWSIIKADTIPLGASVRSDLAQCYNGSAAFIYNIEQKFTEYCAGAIQSFIEGHQIDYIGFHGHTIFHEPALSYTVQIGNGHHLAQHTGIPVIGQFRHKDIALGGQGAPIAPIVEKYLLKGHDAFLNLGGIVNISLHEDHNITAYDLTVCNQALNYLSEKMGMEYDDKGKISATGSVDEVLLNQLNELDFLKQDAPKSLSNTWVQKEIFPLLEHSTIDLADKMRTVIEHICNEIVRSCEVLKSGASIMLSGGGTHNDFLVSTLESMLSPKNIQVIIPSKEIANYKEALLMALMAFLRVNEIPNCLSSVTGASRDNCGGIIYNPSL